MKKLIFVLAIVMGNLIPFAEVGAASVSIPLNGNVRPVTPAEVAAMSVVGVDSSSSIGGRGNVIDLTGSGWNANPSRDLSDGTHEVAVIEWLPVNLPVCAQSIRLQINANLERRSMDITDEVDNLEWIHGLVRGTPLAPEPFDIGTMFANGQYKSMTFGGLNPAGEDVPSTGSGVYAITNGSIDTAAFTRSDLQSPFFSFIYFDTHSPGPQNVEWFGQIAGASVTYDNAACNQSPVIGPIEVHIKSGTPSGAIVVKAGQMNTSDPDGDTMTYSITGGNDQGYFEIDPSTGAITTAQSNIPSGVYRLTVQVSDGNGGVVTAEATIHVNESSNLANTGLGQGKIAVIAACAVLSMGGLLIRRFTLHWK